MAPMTILDSFMLELVIDGRIEPVSYATLRCYCKVEMVLAKKTSRHLITSVFSHTSVQAAPAHNLAGHTSWQASNTPGLPLEMALSERHS
jgi:hypothetical protein